jgi:glutathione synthase/RimK-type ligase-like ATP-grasp enzyme
MCIRGVKKLGLVCGGCDLIMDVNEKFYINEINSGFGLNNPNVELFRDLIVKYCYPE